MSRELRTRITREAHPLSRQRRCQLLEVSRSSSYYQRAGQKAEDDKLMKEIDQLHLCRPFLGSRKICAVLRSIGYDVNRKRVQRLMRLMGIQAIYPRPRTTQKNRKHKVYPYLLRDKVIDKANQVWCADITYIPMEKGFLYLVAIMDWSSRKVLSWQLSNTMEADFCVEALEEAITRYGCPEIFNTDQGSQFTSDVFIDTLEQHGWQRSMDRQCIY